MHKHIINLLTCLETEEKIRANKVNESNSLIEGMRMGAAFAPGSKKRDELIVNLEIEVIDHDTLIEVLKKQIKFYTDKL